jgi:hypothetical protein
MGVMRVRPCEEGVRVHGEKDFAAARPYNQTPDHLFQDSQPQAHARAEPRNCVFILGCTKLPETWCSFLQSRRGWTERVSLKEERVLDT